MDQMANRLITAEEAVRGMLDAARKHVREMPLETVKGIMDAYNGKAVGVSGALGLLLVIAAKERLEQTQNPL